METQLHASTDFEISGFMTIHTEDGALKDRLEARFEFEDPKDPDFSEGPSFEQVGGIHGVQSWILLPLKELEGSFQMTVGPDALDLSVGEESYAGIGVVLNNGAVDTQESLFKGVWFLMDGDGKLERSVTRMFFRFE